MALHPQFSAQSISSHRASADIALLQLVEPIPAKAPALVGTPNEPIGVWRNFIVAGVGVAQFGNGKSGGTVRTARLVTTGRPGNLQIRLIDPTTNNTREGLGACGDSGAPVFEQQDALIVIVGVVSWSTGARNGAGCGGLTGVTPLTLYRDWITITARSWGAR